jgi:hypothetical protein
MLVSWRNCRIHFLDICRTLFTIKTKLNYPGPNFWSLKQDYNSAPILQWSAIDIFQRFHLSLFVNGTRSPHRLMFPDVTELQRPCHLEKSECFEATLVSCTSSAWKWKWKGGKAERATFRKCWYICHKSSWWANENEYSWWELTETSLTTSEVAKESP